MRCTTSTPGGCAAAPSSSPEPIRRATNVPRPPGWAFPALLRLRRSSRPSVHARRSSRPSPPSVEPDETSPSVEPAEPWRGRDETSPVGRAGRASGRGRDETTALGVPGAGARCCGPAGVCAARGAPTVHPPAALVPRCAGASPIHGRWGRPAPRPHRLARGGVGGRSRGASDRGGAREAAALAASASSRRGRRRDEGRRRAAGQGCGPVACQAAGSEEPVSRVPVGSVSHVCPWGPVQRNRPGARTV